LGYVREAVLPALRVASTDAEYCLSVDSPLGRYWISLLQALTTRGETVTVLGRFPREDYENPDAPGAAPVRLPGVRFAFSLPRRTSATTLLSESWRGRFDRRTWAKRLRLSLAVDETCDAAGPFYRLPYGVHPGFAAHGRDALFSAQRPAARTTRVLFAGNTDPRLYDSDLWRARKAQYGIELTRVEAVNLLQERLADDQLLVADWDADDLPRLFDGSSRDKLFMARWNAYRGPEWPRALGAAEFFLALPGVSMPMCHNIIEAMAAGSIPITNYPSWFLPGLVDGQDCLTFTDAASLAAAVERALTMPSTEVQRLRAGVLRYYDRHLAPTRVPEALAALPDGATVYVLTERAEPLADARRGSIAFPGP
jgi:hypothetical protein